MKHLDPMLAKGPRLRLWRGSAKDLRLLLLCRVTYTHVLGYVVLA